MERDKQTNIKIASYKLKWLRDCFNLKKLNHFCRKICDDTPEGLRSLGKFEYFCMITKKYPCTSEGEKSF